MGQINQNMEKNRIIPGTNGGYSINKDGEVFNTKTKREILPYRQGSVKIIRDGKRVTLNVAKTVEVLFLPGYVEEAPRLMQNIKDELLTIRKMVDKLLKEIDREEKTI